MSAESAAYRNAALGVAAALTLTGATGVALSGAKAGADAAAAAGVGAVLAMFTMLAGPVAMLIALRTAPTAAPNIALVASLGSLVVAIAVFVWASTFVESARLPFAATFAVGVLLGMLIKVVAAARARVPYVDPR